MTGESEKTGLAQSNDVMQLLLTQQPNDLQTSVQEQCEARDPKAVTYTCNSTAKKTYDRKTGEKLKSHFVHLGH